MASIVERIRRFDAYAKTADDFRTQTFTGGLVLVMVLSAAAWADYQAIRWRSEVTVDRSREERIPVFFDIVFPRLPCLAVNLDVMDGERRLNNVVENVAKTRLDPQGNSIGPYDEVKVGKADDPSYCGSCYAGADLEGQPQAKETDEANQKKGVCCNSCSAVLAAYSSRRQPLPRIEDVEQCQREGWSQRLKEQAAEGCRVAGSFLVDKSSGDFHFAPGHSYDANRVHVHDLRLLDGAIDFDFTHRIVALHFGQRPSAAVAASKGAALSEPLRGVEFISTDSITVYLPNEPSIPRVERLIYSYFLKVVPTEFRYLSGAVDKTFQYSAARHKKVLVHDDSAFPSLVVRFDISPMLVSNAQYRKSFSSLLISLTAILGGIYTLAAIFDALFFYAERRFLQKVSMGKAN